MNPNDERDPLGAALRKAGRDAAYPVTPRLASRARAQLEYRPRLRLAPGFGLFAGLAGAALVVLLALGLVLTSQQQNATAPPTPGKAYTANLLGGDLSVVDLQRDELTGEIEVGNNPWGMAASPNGEHVYVAVDGGISVVDTARGQRVNFVETNPGYSRAKVAISADERMLLVAGPNEQMRLIDIPTRGTLNEFNIGMVPYDIKLSPDGHWAYVLSETDGSVAVVDLRAGQMVNRLTFSGEYRGYFMAQSPDGRYLYVPRLGKSEIWIIDTQTNQARGTLTEAKPYWRAANGQGTERAVVVSRDGARLYVATEDEFNGGVSVLDTQAFHEIARVNMGGGFFGAALSRDGAQLVLTVPDTHQLTILDAGSLRLVTSIKVGQTPFRVVAAK